MVSFLYCHLYDHEPKKLTSSHWLSKYTSLRFRLPSFDLSPLEYRKPYLLSSHFCLGFSLLLHVKCFFFSFSNSSLELNTSFLGFCPLCRQESKVCCARNMASSEYRVFILYFWANSFSVLFFLFSPSVFYRQT
jgi:hypothetical protein